MHPFDASGTGLSICRECHLLYHRAPVRGLQQRCRCDRREEPTWPGYDFNERIHLCRLCHAELRSSGSRFSVWFCRPCKELVVGFNDQMRRWLIPTGRHSFMVRVYEGPPAPLALAGPIVVRAGEGDEPCCYPAPALIERWDGTAWSVSPSPNVGVYSELRDVVAVAENDVWAVGYSSEGALIEHWDGSAWSPTHLGVPGSALNAIAHVPGTEELWAVGSPPGGGALNAHYVDGSWELVPGPSIGVMNSVTAISSSDVWAAGISVGTPRTTVIQHWDGTQWSAVASPSIGAADNWLNGISSSGKNNVWAVGWYTSATGERLTLTMRWRGSSWQVVPSPNPAVEAFFLDAVALGANDVWAVGYTPGATLSEHYGT